jgi:hypothetical protein
MAQVQARLQALSDEFTKLQKGQAELAHWLLDSVSHFIYRSPRCRPVSAKIGSAKAGKFGCAKSRFVLAVEA